MTLSLQSGGLALLGASAAIVPILIHLLLRQQPKRVVFPALRLLRNRQASTLRKLKLRHLLLLLLRIAALALLGLALARPTLHSTGLFNVDQEAPVAAVVIIDTSPSMELKNQGKTRLDAAKELAHRVMERFADRSEIVIIDSSVPTTHPPIEFAAALERVEKLTIQPGQRPLNQSLEVALRSLSKTGQARGELYVISDMAAHAWALGETTSLKTAYEQIDAPVAVYMLNVGVEKPRNVALSVPRLSQQVLSAQSELVVSAGIQNLGPDLETIVELFVDGQPREQRPVSLHEEVRELNFDVAGLEEGIHQGSLRIKNSDPLPFDDERFFTVEVRPPIRMLVVANTQADADNWINALEPTALRGRSRPRIAIEPLFDPKRLLERDLKDYAVVSLLNVGNLPAGGWEKLKAFVDAGGGLFVALGSRIDSVAYNSDAAQAVLPAKLVGEVRNKENSVVLSADRLSHPLLAPFQALGRNDFSRGFVDRYWKTLAPKTSLVVLPFTNGDPGVVERSFRQGKGGKCILLTTAANYTPTGYWSELPRTWSYVILAEQTVRYLAGIGDVSVNHLVGSAPLVELPANGPFNQLIVTDPKKEVQKVAVEDAAATTIRMPIAKWTGQYTVESADARKPLRKGYSANIPDTESQLDPADPAKLKNILGDDKVVVARDLEALQHSVSQDRVGRELFPFIILLVLIVVSVEGFLSNRFYKSSTPPTEGAKAA